MSMRSGQIALTLFITKFLIEQAATLERHSIALIIREYSGIQVT